jgi:VIT1/CCC1 family predicted Fe2+/Mn2+ transporter
LDELTAIYVGRGLDLILAKQEAEKLMATDALGAHVRDELGLSDTLRARPLQASIASAASFTLGALVPMATVFLVPADWVTKISSVVAVLTLFILGVAAAHLGGAALMKGGMRVAFWGVVAIGLTALVGKFFGTVV